MELEPDLLFIDARKIERMWQQYQTAQQGSYENFSDYVRKNLNTLS